MVAMFEAMMPFAGTVLVTVIASVCFTCLMMTYNKKKAYLLGATDAIRLLIYEEDHDITRSLLHKVKEELADGEKEALADVRQYVATALPSFRITRSLDLN